MHRIKRVYSEALVPTKNSFREPSITSARSSQGHRDQEDLAMELIQLKNLIKESNQERILYKTKFQRAEIELKNKDKQIEQILSGKVSAFTRLSAKARMTGSQLKSRTDDNDRDVAR